jgi:hypothetical protein
MNKKILFITLFPALILGACNTATDSVETSTGPAIDSSAINQDTPIDTVAIQKSLEMKATADAAVASGLNPEHGMPGHRCEIAVGGTTFIGSRTGKHT